MSRAWYGDLIQYKMQRCLHLSQIYVQKESKPSRSPLGYSWLKLLEPEQRRFGLLQAEMPSSDTPGPTHAPTGDPSGALDSTKPIVKGVEPNSAVGTSRGSVISSPVTPKQNAAASPSAAPNAKDKSAALEAKSDSELKGVMDKKLEKEFQRLLNIPFRDLKHDDILQLFAHLTEFVTNPAYHPSIVFPSLKHEFNHGVPHEYLLSKPFNPKANRIALAMQALIQRAEELLGIKSTDQKIYKIVNFALMHRSAECLMKLFSRRALVYSSLPRSIYMNSLIQEGSCNVKPPQQTDFEKIADLKGLTELLKSPNKTFGHFLCQWADSLVEHLIERVTWFCLIAQGALKAEFSFNNENDKIIDLCLIILFKDMGWSKSAKYFFDESTDWHNALTHIPAFKATASLKPVWPHSDDHRKALMDQHDVDATSKFPAGYKFKSNALPRRLFLSSWDDLPSLYTMANDVLRSPPKDSTSSAKTTTELQAIALHTPVERATVIEISPPARMPKEMAITAALQRLLFPHNTFRWYCSGDYYFSQPISRRGWEDIDKEILKYLEKYFGIQLGLPKNPFFKEKNDREKKVLVVNKSKMDALFKHDLILFHFRKGAGINVEALQEFPFVIPYNPIDGSGDSNSPELRGELNLLQHRKERCIPFFELLRERYGFSQRRFEMTTQLPFKELRAEEAKFYSELSALKEDAKSKNFEDLESMLKKAGLDRTRADNSAHPDPNDAYYTLAERCYEINAARAARGDLSSLAQAYSFFEKVPKDNLYFSHARFERAMILLKYPDVLGKLNLFNEVFRKKEDIRKDSIIKAYDLLYELCRSNDGKARFARAYNFVANVLRELAKEDREVGVSFISLFTDSITLDGSIYKCKTVLNALRHVYLKKAPQGAEEKRAAESAAVTARAMPASHHNILKVFVICSRPSLAIDCAPQPQSQTALKPSLLSSPSPAARRSSSTAARV